MPPKFARNTVALFGLAAFLLSLVLFTPVLAWIGLSVGVYKFWSSVAPLLVPAARPGVAAGLVGLMLIALSLVFSFSRDQRKKSVRWMVGLTVVIAVAASWLGPISSPRCFTLEPAKEMVVIAAQGCPTGYRPITPLVEEYLKALTSEGFHQADSQSVFEGKYSMFHPHTGLPMLWVFRYPDGRFDWWTGPGYHPISGVRLEPVSETIYQRFLAAPREDQVWKGK